MITVNSGSADMVKLLRSRGADPTLKRCDGKSARDLAMDIKSARLMAALK